MFTVCVLFARHTTKMSALVRSLCAVGMVAVVAASCVWVVVKHTGFDAASSARNQWPARRDLPLKPDLDADLRRHKMRRQHGTFAYGERASESATSNHDAPWAPMPQSVDQLPLVAKMPGVIPGKCYSLSKPNVCPVFQRRSPTPNTCIDGPTDHKDARSSDRICGTRLDRQNPCWNNDGNVSCLPYFFLQGEMKCGTTSMCAHASIGSPHTAGH